MKACHDEKSDKSPPYSGVITDQFHMQFYRGIDWRKDLKYCGVPILKNPLDLFSISELLWEIKPELVIETGTAYGGSALYMAHIMDHIGRGSIITIDTREAKWMPTAYEYPTHERVKYLIGSSLDPSVRSLVASAARASRKSGNVIVILDSCHKMEHVMGEIEAYAPFVTPSSYLIIEDTNTGLVLSQEQLNEHGPGPAEAIRVVQNDLRGALSDFADDVSLRDRFGFSFNTWMRRKIDE